MCWLIDFLYVIDYDCVFIRFNFINLDKFEFHFNLC